MAGRKTIVPIRIAAGITRRSPRELAGGCREKASSTEYRDIHPLAKRFFVLVRWYVGKPAIEGGTGETSRGDADDKGDLKHQNLMQAEYGRGRTVSDHAARTVAYHRRLKRTSSVGAKQYRPEARRASERSDGNNLRLGNVRRAMSFGRDSSFFRCGHRAIGSGLTYTSIKLS